MQVKKYIHSHQQEQKYEEKVSKFIKDLLFSRIDKYAMCETTLYDLGTFIGKDVRTITKNEFMTAMDKAINVGLTIYNRSLSRVLSNRTTLDKHLKIFKAMLKKMTDIFNLY